MFYLNISPLLIPLSTNHRIFHVFFVCFLLTPSGCTLTLHPTEKGHVGSSSSSPASSSSGSGKSRRHRAHHHHQQQSLGTGSFANVVTSLLSVQGRRLPPSPTPGSAKAAAAGAGLSSSPSVQKRRTSSSMSSLATIPGSG